MRAQIPQRGPVVIPQLEAAAKASGDPEVVNRAKVLIDELNSAAKGNAVRRLMAIRALGERKEKAALPDLARLLDSKEMFVAQYAGRSIALIEGKPVQAPPAASVAEDLWLLPKNCGVVAQFHFNGVSRAIDVRKMLDAVPMMAADQKEQALAQMYKYLLETADQIGNVRIDGGTVGISDDADDNNGSVVVFLRGRYDAKALAALLKKQQIKTSEINGVEAFNPDPGSSSSILLLDNEKVLIVGGPRNGKLPIEEMMGAIKDGKGHLKENDEVVKLVKTVESTGIGWVAAVMSATYKKNLPELSSFDTIALSVKQQEDALVFTAAGQGANADGVKQTIDKFNVSLTQVRDMMKQGIAGMPAMKPYVDFMESIKLDAAGGKATASASLKADLNSMMMMPMIMLRVGDAGPVDAPAEVKVEKELPPDAKPVQK